jgi:hypothetical protein
MPDWQLAEVQLASKAGPEMATGTGSECVGLLSEGCARFFGPSLGVPASSENQDGRGPDARAGG